MGTRSNKSPVVALILLAGSSLFLQSCSTASYSGGEAETIHSQSGSTLVKRSQTAKEIDLLFARYQQADSEKLPRGLQAIMRQMVSIPTDDSKLALDSREAKLRNVSEISDIDDSFGDKYGDHGDEYLFGKKKPTLPLSGGFLNNRGLKSATIKKPEPESKTATLSRSDSSRARLIREDSGKMTVAKGMKKAREVTDELLVSANEALSSAGEAIDKGFAALKKQVTPTAPKKTEFVPPVDGPPPAEDKIQNTKKDQVEVKTQLPNPQEIQTDVSQDISTAKNAFLSRFNRESYSVIHEGVLIVALVIGFLLVSWIRLEYEQANRQQ